MRRELKTLKDIEAVSRKAATIIEEAIAEAIEEAAPQRAPFSLVLPGGSTPHRLFELLGTDWRARLPWDRIHVFWTDERFVAPSHEDSNYGLAKRLFLDCVPIPPEHVHRVPTERADLQSAATAYDEEIRRYFADAGAEGFDVVLMGLGADGHTASLFPGVSVPTDAWATAVMGPAYRPPRERVTLTYRALSASRTVLFLVSGTEKKDALARTFDGLDEDLPASRIQGSKRTLFLVDADASPETNADSR